MSDCECANVAYIVAIKEITQSNILTEKFTQLGDKRLSHFSSDDGSPKVNTLMQFPFIYFSILCMPLKIKYLSSTQPRVI